MRFEQFQGFETDTVSIPSGSTTSTALITNGMPLAIMVLSTAITGTAIALEGSVDGGVTFSPVRDSEADAAVSLTASAGGVYSNLARVTLGLDAVRFVSSSNEAGTRTLRLKGGYT